jgi:hypothetical protein
LERSYESLEFRRAVFHEEETTERVIEDGSVSRTAVLIEERERVALQETIEATVFVIMVE